MNRSMAMVRHWTDFFLNKPVAVPKQRTYYFNAKRKHTNTKFLPFLNEAIAGDEPDELRGEETSGTEGIGIGPGKKNKPKPF